MQAFGHEGTLVSTPGFDVAKALNSFVSMESFIQIGERLEKTIDVFTQPASIIVVHEDSKVVEQDVAALRALERDGMFVLDAKAEQAKQQQLSVAAAPPPAVASPAVPPPGTPGMRLARSSGASRPKSRAPRPPPSGMAFSSPFVGAAARYARARAY